MTKTNKYRPTVAEKKLLKVLTDLNNIGLSVTKICELAKISRNKYYNAMDKEDFRALVDKITLDLVKGQSAEILKATIKFALTEKGHQDRKMLLTIAGIYKDKSDVEVKANVNNPFSELTTEELKKLAKR